MSIFMVKYIFLFCEGFEEDLTCLETGTIFLCDLHLAYILQDQVLQRNISKSLLFQEINPPMDNVGIVCSGAGGGSKYIYSIYIACV